MTLSLPTLLACLGTALMAIAIFAPRRAPVPALPPLATSTIRYDWSAPSEPIAWPLLVDPSAHDLDAAARLELIRALSDLDAPWARDVLQQARAQERDPVVLARLDC